MKNLTLYFLLIFAFFSCKQNEVNGIVIEQDLYIGQSLKQNKKLTKLITQTLNKDSNALAKLTEFWCGAGAGCYDLGFVTTQLAYRIGENDFIKMSKKLTKKQKSSLQELLSAGFEYGNYTDKNIKSEFPKLNKILTN